MTKHELTTPVFDASHFRTVLGHFCTGVTIVTAVDGDTPVGFACQSFQSLSLEPPLVSVAATRTSSSLPRIQAAGRFVANVLTEDQEHVSRAFAVSGADKFAGLGWSLSPAGSPVLDDVLAWVDCEIVDELDGGDHAIVIGRVLDLALVRDAKPLLFFRGQYVRLSADAG